MLNSKRNTSPEYNEKLVQKNLKEDKPKRNIIKENICLVQQLNDYVKEKNISKKNSNFE